MTARSWLVVNIQSGSVIRPGSDRQVAIDYAIREYGTIVSVCETSRTIYVSSIPRL